MARPRFRDNADVVVSTSGGNATVIPVAAAQGNCGHPDGDSLTFADVYSATRTARCPTELEQPVRRFERKPGCTVSSAREGGHRLLGDRPCLGYGKQVEGRPALLWQIRFAGVEEEFFTVRASPERGPCEEVEDGLPDGGHARLRRRSPDSFFSVPLL